MTDIIDVDDQGEPVHALTAEKDISTPAALIRRLRHESSSPDCISDPDPSLWSEAADVIEFQSRRIADLECSLAAEVRDHWRTKRQVRVLEPKT